MLVEAPEGIKQIMRDCKTIAIVGFSDDPGKAGYFVADYLKSVGYKIIPVNPNLKWGLKEKCYASLLDIPKEDLRAAAVKWEMSHTGRNGRIARQLLDYLHGRS